MKNESTRTRVLRTAAELFQRQGFHGTGLRQILQTCAAPKGSLYFHFPHGKEQLAVEAMRAEGKRVARAIERTLAAHAKPAEATRAFLQDFAEVLRRSEFLEGCPVATVTLDAGGQSERIREACNEAYAAWQKLFQQHLVVAGLDERRAESLAILVLTAVEGAFVLSRARRDTRAFDAIEDELVSTIESALEDGRAQRRKRRR